METDIFLKSVLADGGLYGLLALRSSDNGRIQKFYPTVGHLIDAMDEEHDKYWAVLMTGTPSPHSPADWWNQIEVLEPGFIAETNTSIYKKVLVSAVNVTSFLLPSIISTEL